MFSMCGVDDSSHENEGVITNNVSKVGVNLDELSSSGNKSTNMLQQSCHSAQLHLASQQSQHSDTAPEIHKDEVTGTIEDIAMLKTKTGQEATMEFVAESVAKTEECSNGSENAHSESVDINEKECKSCEASIESASRGELCNK